MHSLKNMRRNSHNILMGSLDKDYMKVGNGIVSWSGYNSYAFLSLEKFYRNNIRG